MDASAKHYNLHGMTLVLCSLILKSLLLLLLLHILATRPNKGHASSSVPCTTVHNLAMQQNMQQPPWALGADIPFSEEASAP
jgi:hypothetical protein